MRFLELSLELMSSCALQGLTEGSLPVTQISEKVSSGYQGILSQKKPAPLCLTNLPLSFSSGHSTHLHPPLLLLTFPKSSLSHHTGSLTAMARMKTLTAPLKWPGYSDVGSPHFIVEKSSVHNSHCRPRMVSGFS